MPWTTRGTEADAATTAEIDRQEDRAAAIIAAAFFEDRLTLALCERFVDDPRVVNPLFKGIGPLASFSAKIDLAYLLGIYGASQREKLHIIRNIRNAFAHNLTPLTFETHKINTMCTTLYNPDSMRRIAGRMKQTPMSLTMVNFDVFVDGTLGQMADVPDTPRNRYMVTLKFMLLVIEMLTHAGMVDKLIAQEEAVAAPSPLLDKSSSRRPRRSQTGSRTRKKKARLQRPSPE